MMIRQSIGDGTSSPEQVWGWRLGERVLVAHRNEAYSGLQKEMRAPAPQGEVAVLNLVNGSVGYLPLRHLYGEDVYTVWQTPYGRGTFEHLISAAKTTVESLIAGP